MFITQEIYLKKNFTTKTDILSPEPVKLMKNEYFTLKKTHTHPATFEPATS